MLLAMHPMRALAISMLATVVVGAVKVCPFLPVESAPALEYSLPQAALSNPKLDLSIVFEGVSSPIVTRKPLLFGSTPKVIIERYSSKPTIEYDENNGSVIISANGCEPTDLGSASSASTGRFRFIAAAVSITLGVIDEGVRTYAWAAALYTVFGNLIPVAQASDEDCSPTVKVLVEAPEAYMGAVETCWADINDESVCPLPFPTFKTCDDPNPTCGVAVVGAGAGGLYTALRMVDAGKVAASDICVFEMTERVGGRLFSLRGVGADNDLSVDAGGYRTWPLYTPTLHALITEYLGIPMGCYDDTEPCERFNIVDENGNKAGFASFIEEMMKRLVDGGACFYPYHELTRIVSEGRTTTEIFRNSLGTSSSELYFSNGVKATASMTTILNIPQRPLMNIVRESNFDAVGILNSQNLDALHSVQSVLATKLYLYYPRGHVFWYKLGLRVGDFEFEGDARNMLLGGRYHDGHVNCDDENDINTCHGFLLAVYVSDLSGNKAQFFRRYQRERAEPVTFISNQDLEGSEFLAHAHSRLQEYHLYHKTDGNYSGFEVNRVFEETSPPEFAVLSTWNVAVPWAGAAWHAWTELDNIDLALEPFVDNNIFVVNEAFSLLHGWAEGSIKVADKILEKYFDIERPWSFPVVDLNQIVQQTNSQECAEPDDDGTTSGGGGQGGGDGTAGGATDDDPFCFVADALVRMTDGTSKRIEDVLEGDYVMTGTNHGEGLVTQKLVHPVGDVVPVAIIETDDGELIGTPSHPVLFDGEWKELVHLPGVESSSQYVDAFYNLEVDGHLTDESTHSYVVHGITASGLGDNKVLNRLYPRQESWKNAAAADQNLEVSQA